MSEQIQKLIDEYKQFQVDRYRLGLEEARILEAIDKLSENGPCDGSITIDGIADSIKVNRRHNVRYDKERGAPHPLIAYREQFPEIEAATNLDVKESGKKKAKLVFGTIVPQDAEQRSELDVAILEIRKIRLNSPGKLSLEIKDNKNAPAED